MPAEKHTPYPGIETHWNPKGIFVAQLHYSADPQKALGEKTFVPEINKWLSPWALAQFNQMSEAMYRQELEIDFAAKLGSPMFALDEEATLCDSFPVPAHWTWYHALDPHPRVPHAHLWAAVDPHGEVYMAMELWPSKVYGVPGNIPEDDNRHSIKEYCETAFWMESGKHERIRVGENEYDGNPANEKRLNVRARIIDYAARGMGQGTIDDPEQPNFQQRYENRSEEVGKAHNVDYRWVFEDAKKDRDVGIELVNEWLKPREVETASGWKKKSKVHIFRDKCPELIWELKNNRYKQLTPQQAEISDPLAKAVQKRNHMTDALRYLLMANPEYVAPVSRVVSTHRPIHSGVSY